MFHYRCPRCGNVSDEGFSIIGGPECVKCGTEMVVAPGEDDVREANEKESRPVARGRPAT